MKKIFLVLLLGFLITLGCESKNGRKFELIWLKELPPTCNYALTIIKVFQETQQKTPIKDFSFISGLSTKCLKAIDRLTCRIEVYGYSKDSKGNVTGVQKVDYTDGIKYRNFTQCLADKK